MVNAGLKRVRREKFGGRHHFAENYCDTVVDPVQSYKAMGCNMSLNVHFVDSLLSLLP